MSDDFDKWVDQWDQAQKSGAFASKKPISPSPKSIETDFFGNYVDSETSKHTSVSDVDAEYWEKLHKLTNDGHPADPHAILTEAETKAQFTISNQGKLRNVPTSKELGTKAGELGNTGNPVYPNTRGRDDGVLPNNERKITPDWIDGTKLSEINNMKFNLYQLESKLNADPNFGSFSGDSVKIKKIQKQIDGLKDQIDQLSNDLSPDFVRDELS